MTQEQLQQLEMLIDRNGLANLIKGISTVCYLKATHIENNWQDKPLADEWTKVAKAADKMTRTHPVVRLSK